MQTFDFFQKCLYNMHYLIKFALYDAKMGIKCCFAALIVEPKF